jgi:hypothetical protein
MRRPEGPALLLTRNSRVFIPETKPVLMEKASRARKEDGSSFYVFNVI